MSGQNKTTRPVCVIGFGGHGRVVAASLRAAGIRIAVATDHCPIECRDKSTGFPVLNDDELKLQYSPSEIDLVLGIGWIQPVGTDSTIRKIIDSFRSDGYRFIGFRHPSAWVADDAKIASTAQIHAGALVQSGASIEDFAILNTRSSVDHDCRIGAFSHIAPGVTLSGNVVVGNGTHIGTGASVIQSLHIGEQCMIAAGATVVKDLVAQSRVRGTPARPFS